MAIMCEKCGKRPATTLTKVYINGVYSEQYLCSECDKSYTISHELFPDNIIASLFGVAPKKRRGIRVCRNCGNRRAGRRSVARTLRRAPVQRAD